MADIIQDNVCLAGVPCEFGTKVFSDWIPTTDATVVTRILEAGGTVRYFVLFVDSVLTMSQIVGKGTCENCASILWSSKIHSNALQSARMECRIPLHTDLSATLMIKHDLPEAQHLDARSFSFSEKLTWLSEETKADPSVS